MPIDTLAKPLSDDEITELDELLAALPEERDSLDVVMLDGFLTGILLQPAMVPPSAWLPRVFDAQGGAIALPGERGATERAIALVMRRYNELAAHIAAREPFDPIVCELEDRNGQPLASKDGIAALIPWAAGFMNALSAFPTLLDRLDDNRDLAAAMMGIVRHLPVDPDQSGPEGEAFSRERAELDRDVPLANLDEAIEDLVASVLDVAEITRPNLPVQRAAPKVGRNARCPCGSGRKFKNCHGRSLQ